MTLLYACLSQRCRIERLKGLHADLGLHRLISISKWNSIKCNAAGGCDLGQAVDGRLLRISIKGIGSNMEGPYPMSSLKTPFIVFERSFEWEP